MAAAQGGSGAAAHANALNKRACRRGGACSFAYACCEVMAAAQGGSGAAAHANALNKRACCRGGARSFASACCEVMADLAVPQWSFIRLGAEGDLAVPQWSLATRCGGLPRGAATRSANALAVGAALAALHQLAAR